jgi:hypothetical protein
LVPDSSVGKGRLAAWLVARDNRCPKMLTSPPGATAGVKDAPFTIGLPRDSAGWVKVNVSKALPSVPMAFTVICDESAVTRR